MSLDSESTSDFDDLLYRGFKIVSRAQDHPPVGINPTKLITQHIFVHAGFDLWQAHKVSNNKYRLTIGGYPSTGVVESGNIAVSVYPQFGVPWEITYYQSHDAYTITLADDHRRGWTVTGSGMVELHPIKAVHAIPPNQLFVFEAGGRY